MSTETSTPPPKPPTVINSLAQLSELAPVRYRVAFTHPPGEDGQRCEVFLRPLTGAERVEIEQYDPDNVEPPKWGACPPDVAPSERPGEYDLKNPDYIAKRRKMADLFNAYLLDKCLGLGLPETREVGRAAYVASSNATAHGGVVEIGLSSGERLPVTLEDKARWVTGEAVEGLPENRLLRSYVAMLINECHRLNYGGVAKQADF